MGNRNIQKSFTVTINVPFKEGAPDDALFDTDPQIALHDMANIGLLDHDAVVVSNVVVKELTGEESAAVDAWTAKMDAEQNADDANHADHERMMRELVTLLGGV